MNEIRKKALKEITKRYQQDHDKINNSEEEFKNVLSYHGKQYKGTIKQQVNKMINFLNKKEKKEIEQLNNKIDSINNAEPFNNEFIITVEWKKSRMWGKNPTASTNYGFVSESIGGCGYCKLSTATAQALNNNLRILKLLYSKMNKYYLSKEYLNKETKKNHQVLGYGSGYGLLPYFEGGVGVTSHEIILSNVGLKMRCITSTSNTDVYLITKEVI